MLELAPTRRLGRSRRIRSGSFGFRPTMLGNIVLWLRADSANVSLDGSNNVQGWTDRSGAGNNFTQATAANRPGYTTADAAYNGKPTTNYIGGTRFISGPTWNLPQPCTFYFAAHATLSAAAEAFMEGSASRMILRQEATEVWGFFAGTLITSVSSNDGLPHCFAVVFNGASSALYIDHWNTPNTTGNPGAGGQDVCELGGLAGFTDGLAGSIAEVATFSVAHGPTQIKPMFQYMGREYAIAVAA